MHRVRAYTFDILYNDIWYNVYDIETHYGNCKLKDNQYYIRYVQYIVLIVF